MTLLLGFLMSSVMIGMFSKHFSSWTYLMIVASASITTFAYFNFSRFWG